MAQTSYADRVVGQVGSIAEAGPIVVRSKTAYGKIPIGRGVVKYYGNPNLCRLPAQNQCVILDSGGTFTAGSIATAVTISKPGEASGTTTTITTAWGSDKDTTMAAHAAAILAGVSGVSACAYVGASTHTITITSLNDSISGVATSVASVTGTMTITSYTYTSTDTAAGISGFAINSNCAEQVDSVVEYTDTETVNVLIEGCVLAYADEAVTSDGTLYMRTLTSSAKLPGMFCVTNTSGGTVATSGIRVESNTSGAGIIKLNFNLPQ